MSEPTSENLPRPEPGRDGAEAFVARYLGDLVCDDVVGSAAFRGGQRAADAALAGFDVSSYARQRNEVHPEHRRGASRLSPYIRHGLLTLSQVWDHVAGGPSRDVSKFRDELAWQEYARHWYARLGSQTAGGVRYRLESDSVHGAANGIADAEAPSMADGWSPSMRCLEMVVGELTDDGWLVNQTRMWLASHWSVRQGYPWLTGEDHFFRHLLDGSRAANRLGWQWVTGAGSSKSYGFSRRQVERRAPGVCEQCALRENCPIEQWPDDPVRTKVESPPGLRRDPAPEVTAGPAQVETVSPPDVVWLTAESLSRDDPALVSHPELPALFVFDEPLLRRLGLSSKRLVFLVETLAELAEDRTVDLVLGSPATVLRDRAAAVTYAPVPGFRKLAGRLDLAELHPWPWLYRPGPGPVTSFTAWRRKQKR